MTIYIDSEYKCHTENDGTMRLVETDFFDGKCKEFIEGYKFDTSKGYAQVYPWKPYHDLAEAQAHFEHNQLEVMKHENEELMNDIASLIEDLYESDLERIDE